MRLLGLAPLALALAATSAAAADRVSGEWVTPGGDSRVRIAPCEGQPTQVCGKIVWLKSPTGPTGQPLRDANNSDPKLRDRPVLGLQLMSGFKPAGDGRWSGGRIYDPQSGRTYASKLSLEPNGALKVEGCVVGVCRAQTWRPAT